MTNYVAIDIGGTNIKYGLIDQDGQLIESHEVASRKRTSVRCSHFLSGNG